MKNIIIIGASSGIGEALARRYAKQRCVLGLAARRVDLLDQLSRELETKTYTIKMDVTQPEDAMNGLNQLIRQMNGADLIIICAGTGHMNPALVWAYEKDTIDVNVFGFSAVANAAFQYIAHKKAGHLVALSSVAALRGSRECPAYNASKAYMSNYMEGLRCKAGRISRDITITDIKPGFVDTAMAQGDHLFWVAAPEKVAAQIAHIIDRRKAHGYVTKRWRILAFFMKRLPGWLYAKL
jgi:short-subunit dehydrogenase